MGGYWEGGVLRFEYSGNYKGHNKGHNKGKWSVGMEMETEIEMRNIVPKLQHT